MERAFASAQKSPPGQAIMAFGFGLLGFAFSVAWSLLWYGLVGLVIGGLGRLIVSGRQDMNEV